MPLLSFHNFLCLVVYFRTSDLRVCRIFIKFGIGVLCKKLSIRLGFRLGDSCALYKRVKESSHRAVAGPGGCSCTGGKMNVLNFKNIFFLHSTEQNKTTP